MDNKIPDNQITFYQSPDGSVHIEVLYSDENVWLTQKVIAELFNTSIPNINMHLKGIFGTQELDKNSVVKESLITANYGKNY